MKPLPATALDREHWSYVKCEFCNTRMSQLTIDTTPKDRNHGTYLRTCWQCYWFLDVWKRGPICNCGPMWDGVDCARIALADMQHSSPT